jgi:hypothetical protein
MGHNMPNIKTVINNNNIKNTKLIKKHMSLLYTYYVSNSAK